MSVIDGVTEQGDCRPYREVPVRWFRDDSLRLRATGDVPSGS